MKNSLNIPIGGSYFACSRLGFPLQKSWKCARWVFCLATAFIGLAQLLHAQTAILSEGFEGRFPDDNGWSIGDNNSTGTPAYWRDVNAVFAGEGTHSGAWKGYCAGFGYAGTSDDPQYQDEMTSYMARTIDLIGYRSASLSFWYKIPSIDSGYDYARVYIDSIDPVLVWFTTTTVADWTEVTIDLSAYVGTSPTLRFEFFSDRSKTAEGWYLDDIMVLGFSPPSNDLCSGAIALSSCVPYTMDTSNATSAGDPLPTCQTNFGHGVWFTYTPSSDGPVKVSTCGSSFDTAIQAYSGTCRSLVPIACADDVNPDCPGTHQETVQFNGTADTVYHLLAGGYGGASGIMQIAVLDTTPPDINCPSNIVANADPGQSSKSNVTWSVTANDNCPGVTVACNPPSGSTFPAGVTMVICTAIDASGNTNSCSFTVTIIGAELPQITMHPKSQNVPCGSDVRFTVQAFSTAPLSYQWRFNDAEIPGATEESYSLTGATLTDVGRYSIWVSNETGTVPSEAAWLDVGDEPPGLRIEPKGTILNISWPVTCTSFQLEECASLALQSKWTPVALAPLVLGGRQVVSAPVPVDSRFYRLKSGPVGIPLADVPPNAVALANELLQTDFEGTWSNAVLAPVAYAVYDPAIQGGNEWAYVEFKVIPGPTMPVASGETDLGYLLVSLTEQDVPIPEFAGMGPTKTERLWQAARSTAVRIIRYSNAFWVAEDRRGQFVASLGSLPYRLPEELLSFSGQTACLVVSNTPVIEPETPPFACIPYQSYQELKSDYVDGAVYRRLRAYRADSARLEWELRRDKVPDLIHVDLDQETPILAGLPIEVFNLQDPSVATVRINDSGGLWVFGTKNGGTLLHVWLKNGTGAYYLLQLGQTEGAQAKKALRGWGPWQYYWAGGWGDQSRYSQESNLAGCCANGPSGCGATAWAMFYGWWDKHGICTLIGDCSHPTPLTNDVSVRECIKAVFGYINSVCVNIPWLGINQTATSPWAMHKGWSWTGQRPPAKIYCDSAWTLAPGIVTSPHNKAVHAICVHHRPAIVGTGYLYHYPLAFGYANREYTIWGIHIWTSEWWFVNNGNANQAGEWANADFCWFGMDAYCFK